ncbi:MAG: YlmC/YmxH family sporulation protein [Clostridiales bacterium]|nr:YlmC/YmxH family sporulation protein [Clostridiales bacterium]
MTFTDLRSKDLINSSDGKRLGKACDIVFDSVTGKIRGIVAPYGKKSYFGKGQDIFIPFKCILKIGEDIVLVDVNCQQLKPDQPPHYPPPPHECEEKPPHKPPPVPPCEPQKPNCDMRCEKCMLFDCAYRWKNN